MAEAAQGGIHEVGGYDAPQSVCEATASWAPSYAPKGKSPTKRGAEVVVVELEAGPPPALRVRPPPPPPTRERGQGGSPAPPSPLGP